MNEYVRSFSHKSSYAVLEIEYTSGAALLEWNPYLLPAAWSSVSHHQQFTSRTRSLTGGGGLSSLLQVEAKP
jgi:hypothetical protein